MTYFDQISVYVSSIKCAASLRALTSDKQSAHVIPTFAVKGNG